MVEVVHDQKIGKVPSWSEGRRNRSVHYWWKVRRAGARFYNDQWLWHCPQCGTSVVKTEMESDRLRQPSKMELLDAGVDPDCMDQTIKSVMAL